jgi:hypothetical protein
MFTVYIPLGNPGVTVPSGNYIPFTSFDLSSGLVTLQTSGSGTTFAIVASGTYFIQFLVSTAADIPAVQFASFPVQLVSTALGTLAAPNTGKGTQVQGSCVVALDAGDTIYLQNISTGVLTIPAAPADLPTYNAANILFVLLG